MMTRISGPLVGRGVSLVLADHPDTCVLVDLVSWIAGAPVDFDCPASDEVLGKL